MKSKLKLMSMTEGKDIGDKTSNRFFEKLFSLSQVRLNFEARIQSPINIETSLVKSDRNVESTYKRFTNRDLIREK